MLHYHYANALVYEAEDFPLESSGLWWDGRQNLELAPEGTYVYFIEIELEDGELEQFSGKVRVIH